MKSEHVDDSPADDAPPNRLYAAQHAETIRFLAKQGMSRQNIEAIYGRTAVAQVLGAA